MSLPPPILSRHHLCLGLGTPLLLTVVACSSPPPSTGPVSDADVVSPPPATALELLADKEIHVVKVGDWTDRTVRRPRTLGSTSDPTATKGGGGAGFGGVGGSAEGDGMAVALDAPTGGSRGPAEAPALKRASGAARPMAAPERAPSRKKKPRSRSDSKARRRPAPQGNTPLKAGSIDDNRDFAAFVKFLLTWSDREETAGQVQAMDVRGRTFISVVDDNGAPIPAAKVEVRSAGDKQVLWTGTTYGDGRVPYYPRIAHPKVKGAMAGGVQVTASHRGIKSTSQWDEAADVRVVVDTNKRLTQPVQLDVLFVLDTTGSMGDELSRIKASLAQMTEKLRGHGKEFDLRYGAVLYKDITDDYVTRTHPFTGDVARFAKALQQVRAGGGGDGPESMNQGLYEGVERMQWRDGAAKVMFLIADAPPHMDYAQDILYGTAARIAVEKGIRIHSVAASGLPPFGSLAFRQVAQLARGKFIFIEYGNNVTASGEKHGVSGVKKSNNLDDILFEQVSDELANWGRKRAKAAAK